MKSKKLKKHLTVLWVLPAAVLIAGVSFYASGLAEQTPNIKTLDYKMDLEIDYKNEVLTGDCRITVANENPGPLAHVPVLLYRLLDVTSVTGSGGEALTFTSTVTKFTDWTQYQVNYVVIDLARPLEKDEKTTLRIKYSGHLLGYGETGSYVKEKIDKAFTMIRPDCLAYPEVGYPSWKVNKRGGFQSFNYLVNVTVPGDTVVANGGELVGKTSENGFTTYTFKNVKPAWRIDIAAADYRIVKDVSGKMTVYCMPDHEQGARDIMTAMEKAQTLFSQWFGPLEDFKVFSVIEIPEGFGSQTDVTCIIQTADAFDGKDDHYQFYHELSHLWNVRMLDPLPCRVESEGLAMFLQHWAQEKLENKTNAVKDNFKRLREWYIERCKKNPHYKDIPMADHGKKGVTGLSYGKGMLFFNLLYELVGEKEFFEIIESFYREFKDGAYTKDFTDHLNRYPGKDLSSLVDDWFYGTQSSVDLLAGLTVNELLEKYR